MDTMKALHVTRPGTFELVEVSIPDWERVGPNHTLIQPRWGFLCGSEIPFSPDASALEPISCPGAPIHE